MIISLFCNLFCGIVKVFRNKSIYFLFNLFGIFFNCTKKIIFILPFFSVLPFYPHTIILMDYTNIIVGIPH